MTQAGGLRLLWRSEMLLGEEEEGPPLDKIVIIFLKSKVRLCACML